MSILSYIKKLVIKFVRFCYTPHRVTFDSNVWQQIASPDEFIKSPELDSYRKIHKACNAGKIQGFLSETTLTLEQIKKEDRLKWIQSIGQPSSNVVPQTKQIVQNRLDDAYNIGIRVLRSKRIGGPSSALLSGSKYFLSYSSDAEYHYYNDKSGDIARALEAMGVGIANIKGKSMSLHKAIASMPSSEKIKIAELIAEWADADAVATSIAHDVKYFCTNDIAKGSSGKGIVSTMSTAKSKDITSKFCIEFINPNNLVRKLGL